MLQRALESEIDSHLRQYDDLLTNDGKKAVVRNGYGPQRSILTGIGSVSLRRPRVDEREAVQQNPNHKRFSSSILPAFLRRTPSIDGAVATLYLKGISSNDFESALHAIYGEDAGSMSASTVARLKN
ncbi:transposase, partial [Alkalispirochaeta sphaeroplastigenens]|uniref:transposase n=1 Tax=Alkalispirochaeta sphaeroplastigenens TaxID=1187066 RepID=UPI001FE52F1E